MTLAALKGGEERGSREIEQGSRSAEAGGEAIIRERRFWGVPVVSRWQGSRYLLRERDLEGRPPSAILGGEGWLSTVMGESTVVAWLRAKKAEGIGRAGSEAGGFTSMRWGRYGGMWEAKRHL